MNNNGHRNKTGNCYLNSKPISVLANVFKNKPNRK